MCLVGDWGIMRYRNPETTVSVMPCSACGFGLLEHDRFCRRCGSKQAGISSLALFIAPQERLPEATSSDLARPPGSFQTTTIAKMDIEEDLYRSISGPLVQRARPQLVLERSCRILRWRSQKSVFHTYLHNYLADDGCAFSDRCLSGVEVRVGSQPMREEPPFKRL